MGGVTAEAGAGHRLERHRRGAWTALVSRAGETVWAAIAVGQVLAPDSVRRDLLRRCSPVLRDDSRSFVGILVIDGQKLVAKSFREQDRRLPARIVNQPETGIATNEPAPSPAIAAPSAAGDSPSAS